MFMSSSSALRLGVIGAGRMGQYHINVIKELSEAVLSGFYDTNTKHSKEVARRFDARAFESIDELLKECDGIVVAAPTGLHYEIGMKALKEGVHVLIEKPITNDVSQARKLVNAAAKKALVLQVGHIERFNGAVQELRNIVKEPQLIETRRLAPYDKRIRDTGVVFDLMIHDLDIVLNLVGERIISVDAWGRKVFSDYEDVASATVQFESGAIAVINASRATQAKVRTLTVSQKDAYILLDYTTQDIEIHRQSTSATNIVLPKRSLNYRQESSVERVFIHRDNQLKLEVSHFIACINGSVKPLVCVDNDVVTLQVAKKILDKISKNHPSNGVHK